MDLRAPGRKDKVLAPIRPSEAAHRQYRQALDRAVVAMRKSYLWWLSNRYRDALEANVEADRLPDLAQDAAPGSKARTLFAELKRLQKHWDTYFDQLATRLATKTVDALYRENVNAWKGQMRKAGFTVDLQLTPSQRLILDAKVQENVSLIRSIPEQFHKDVEGIVLRSFTAGRDLHTMAAKIKERGDVTTRRAALIARDQSNKATAQMNAARQRELGLTYATWKHSSAGKEPRHDHVRAGREGWIFDTQKGIDFGDGFGPVLPGEAINCRCVSRTIIPAIGRGLANGKQFDPEKLEAVSGFPGAYTQG